MCHSLDAEVQQSNQNFHHSKNQNLEIAKLLSKFIKTEWKSNQENQNLIPCLLADNNRKSATAFPRKPKKTNYSSKFSYYFSFLFHSFLRNQTKKNRKREREANDKPHHLLWSVTIQHNPFWLLYAIGETDIEAPVKAFRDSGEGSGQFPEVKSSMVSSGCWLSSSLFRVLSLLISVWAVGQLWKFQPIISRHVRTKKVSLQPTTVLPTILIIH